MQGAALSDRQSAATIVRTMPSVLADLPASTAKKLPRYLTVPAVRMGRLAVDQAHERLGGALLADALHRAVLLKSPFTP